MSLFFKKIIFPVLVFIAVFIIILYIVTNYQNTTASVSYTLKSHKNTVALYKNDEIIKVYDNIVLNTLPEKDIQNFNAGISVTTPTQAETYLEDFE